MQVENWPIGNVIPYGNNPRKNDDAVEKVAASLREFGWQQPIVVDKDGVIICGHTRAKAAQMLGLEEVPVVVASSLTQNQVDAYRLVDNKTGELSSWDWEKLNDELENIDWLDINMEDFGFSACVDIDQFFSDSEDGAEPAGGSEDEPKEVKCPHCGMYFTI